MAGNLRTYIGMEEGAHQAVCVHIQYHIMVWYEISWKEDSVKLYNMKQDVAKNRYRK